MPIYEITTKDEEKKRLVRADSAAQAVRHCAQGMFTARTVSKVEDVADLIEAGVKVEKPSDEAAAQAEPEPKAEPDIPEGGKGSRTPPPSKDD